MLLFCIYAGPTRLGRKLSGSCIGGIGELSAVVNDDTVHSMFQAMGSYLRAAIAQCDLSEEKEASLVQPVNLFESPSQSQCKNLHGNMLSAHRDADFGAVPDY